MAEGFPAPELAKEIAALAHHHRHGSHDRALIIGEAVLLSVVTLISAWSGYAAAKWNTERSILLAQAAALRSQANRENLAAMELRNFDASTFNTWFTAFVTGNERWTAMAERRFRPEFRVAFDAWRATDPAAHADGPPGPTYMPEYRLTQLEKAAALDQEADDAFAEGRFAGETSDRYVRTTIFLASVLFLVGISSHFAIRGVRYALIALGTIMLLYSGVQLMHLPRPPDGPASAPALHGSP